MITTAHKFINFLSILKYLFFALVIFCSVCLFSVTWFSSLYYFLLSTFLDLNCCSFSSYEDYWKLTFLIGIWGWKSSLWYSCSYILQDVTSLTFIVIQLKMFSNFCCAFSLDSLLRLFIHEFLNFQIFRSFLVSFQIDF